MEWRAGLLYTSEVMQPFESKVVRDTRHSKCNLELAEAIRVRIPLLSVRVRILLTVC